MIAVIDYGMGNLRSVQAGLKSAGQKSYITDNPKEVINADGVVLPGVGAFGEGIEKLKQGGMAEALNNAVVAEKKPFLGICLGMQLIC